jgi:hypothetical protein
VLDGSRRARPPLGVLPVLDSSGWARPPLRVLPVLDRSGQAHPPLRVLPVLDSSGRACPPLSKKSTTWPNTSVNFDYEMKTRPVALKSKKSE